MFLKSRLCAIYYYFPRNNSGLGCPTDVEKTEASRDLKIRSWSFLDEKNTSFVGLTTVDITAYVTLSN